MKALKLPDGTVCRTGPHCRLHGDLHTLQEQVFATYEAKKHATKKAESKWMEDTEETRKDREAFEAKQRQYVETSKADWPNARAHNIGLYRKFKKDAVENQNYVPQQHVIHPLKHKRRVNLFLFACGVLDVARYQNLTTKNIEKDLHEEPDGNWRERSEYYELKDHIEQHYAEEFADFQKRFADDTDNFSAVETIKAELHHNMFVHPKFERFDDFMMLLNRATQRSLIFSGHKNEKGVKLPAPTRGGACS